MPENFNSKTVADRVVARLDLTCLSAVATAARVLPNTLKIMWLWRPRKRDRRLPRQAKVPALQRGRKYHVA